MDETTNGACYMKMGDIKGKSVLRITRKELSQIEHFCEVFFKHPWQ